MNFGGKFNFQQNQQLTPFIYYLRFFFYFALIKFLPFQRDCFYKQDIYVAVALSMFNFKFKNTTKGNNAYNSRTGCQQLKVEAYGHVDYCMRSYSNKFFCWIQSGLLCGIQLYIQYIQYAMYIYLSFPFISFSFSYLKVQYKK